MTGRLRRFDDGEFLLRGDAGKYPDPADGLGQLRWRRQLHLRTLHHFVWTGGDTEFVGDSQSRDRVVTRDHDDPYAGVMASTHCRGGAFAQRIDQPDQRTKLQANGISAQASRV